MEARSRSAILSSLNFMHRGGRAPEGTSLLHASPIPEKSSTFRIPVHQNPHARGRARIQVHTRHRSFARRTTLPLSNHNTLDTLESTLCSLSPLERWSLDSYKSICRSGPAFRESTSRFSSRQRSRTSVECDADEFPTQPPTTDEFPTDEFPTHWVADEFPTQPPTARIASAYAHRS